MYSHSVFVLISSAVLATWFATNAHAADHDTVLFYDFEDTSGSFELDPEIIAPGVDAARWFDRHGTLTDFSGNPGRAMAARGFDIDNAFVLELTIARGFALSVESFAFDQLASTSGPVSWSLTVNDRTIADGSTSTVFESRSGSVGAPMWWGDIVLEIAGAGASSDRGTFRLDNFELTGSLHSVPLPTPFALLLSGLLTLLRRT